jgi:hypothetical protein
MSRSVSVRNLLATTIGKKCTHVAPGASWYKTRRFTMDHGTRLQPTGGRRKESGSRSRYTDTQHSSGETGSAVLLRLDLLRRSIWLDDESEDDSSLQRRVALLTISEAFTLEYQIASEIGRMSDDTIYRTRYDRLHGRTSLRWIKRRCDFDIHVLEASSRSSKRHLARALRA